MVGNMIEDVGDVEMAGRKRGGGSGGGRGMDGWIKNRWMMEKGDEEKRRRRKEKEKEEQGYEDVKMDLKV